MKKALTICAGLLVASCVIAQTDKQREVYVANTVPTTAASTTAVTGVVHVASGSVDSTPIGTTAITGTVHVATEPTVAQIPWRDAVGMGLVSGYSKVNKFGHNLATTTGEDVWGGGGVYGFYPTTGQTVYAVSSSADDDAAGTGIQSVVYYGLDDNWLLANETVATDGTTPVQLVNSYVRMFRGAAGTTGGSDSNIGAFTVTNDAGTVAINIGAGDGQTQHAVYTIPAGKTGYIAKWAPGISDGGNSASRESAKFNLMMRPNGGAWLIKGEAECINDGTTHFSDEYAILSGPIAAKTDIRIYCSFASTSLGTVGRFDLILKDN